MNSRQTIEGLYNIYGNLIECFVVFNFAAHAQRIITQVTYMGHPFRKEKTCINCKPEQCHQVALEQLDGIKEEITEFFKNRRRDKDKKSYLIYIERPRMAIELFKNRVS